MHRLTSLTGLVVAVLFVSIVAGQDKSSPTAAPSPQTTPASSPAPAAASAPAPAGAAASTACTAPAKGEAAPAGTAPTLDAIPPGLWVTGKASKGAQIVICVDGKQAATAGPATAASDGTFHAQLDAPLVADKMITAQEKTPGMEGKADTFGPLSGAVSVGAQPECTAPATNTSSKGAAGAAAPKPAAGAAATLAAPTLDSANPGYWVTGEITVQNPPQQAQIVVCVDGKKAETVAGTMSTDSDGKFHVQLKNKLAEGQKITVQQTSPATASAAAAYGTLSTAVTVGANAASFDFGRVRVYLSAGAILSQDQGQFSKTSTYLDFSTDNTWLMRTFPAKSGKDKLPAGFQINTLFDARLTALPTTSCPQATTGTGNNTGTCTADNTSISVSTPKGALIAAGVYFPIYFGWSSWKFDDHRHALYFAPIAAGGFQTLVQSAQSSNGASSGTTAPTTTTTPDGRTFFHFAQFGSRFGLYRFHDENPSIAPDQLLYLDVAAGSYENFPRVNSAGMIAGYPWRLSLQGRFLLPKIPVFLGFDSSTRPGRGTGIAPGDLRFLFGTAFDVGCLLQKVGVSNPGIAACDNTKSSSTSTQAGK